MRTLLLAFGTLCLVSGVGAQSPVLATPSAAVQPAQSPKGSNNPSHADFLKWSGGLIATRQIGPHLVFLNAQREAPAALVANTAQDMLRFLGLANEVRVADAKLGGVALAESVLKEGTNRVSFVVVLTAEKAAPTLLIAPENRWAVVNVLALRSDKANQETFEKRVQREQWRAVCHVMGAANSSFEHCAMRPVFAPQDLDALALTASPEAFSRMQSSIVKAGMHPAKMTTYRQAVGEGWAPDPTNDIQRAVWDQVKAEHSKK